MLHISICRASRSFDANENNKFQIRLQQVHYLNTGDLRCTHLFFQRWMYNNVRGHSYDIGFKSWWFLGNITRDDFENLLGTNMLVFVGESWIACTLYCWLLFVVLLNHVFVFDHIGNEFEVDVKKEDEKVYFIQGWAKIGQH